jgi:ornithine carbamoyltransferase
MGAPLGSDVGTDEAPAALNVMNPPTRDLLALSDLGAIDLIAIIERAQTMAALWDARRMPQSLATKRVALVVNEGGWRNTTAFDIGIQSMGGLCIHAPLRWDAREELTDLAAYLGNWFDGVVTRAADLSLMRSLAEAFDGPVLNARTRLNHPFETLGDLAFSFHRRGRIDGMKVAVVAPTANILGSWIEAAAVLPLDVVQVFPAKWHAPAAPSVPRFRTSADMGELEDADLIVTDCWPEGAEPSELQGFKVTAVHLGKLHPEASFVPCPPVSRGKEVSVDAMLHPACRVIAAKAFLLHAQNAALEWAFARP